MGTVHERGPQRGDGNSFGLLQAEEGPLAFGLVRCVRIGKIGGGKLVGLFVVESVPIGGHAGGEDVPAEGRARHRPCRRRHLVRSGPAFPVIDVVEHQLERFTIEGRADRGDVVPVAADLAHPVPERRPVTAVHDGHVIAAREELVHHGPADELGAADHEYPCHGVRLRISSAASRPDAPMMPPPGCVPAPHCQ